MKCKKCEGQATHQVADSRDKLCGAHASQVKRDGKIVALLPERERNEPEPIEVMTNDDGT